MFPELFRDDVFRLETERLWLRWPRAQDAARVAELAGERAVAEMSAHIPHPYPPGEAARFVLTSRAGNFAGEQVVLALTFKQRPGDLIGCVGLSGEGVAHLGYWLGKPWWGRGLMTEAAGAIVDLVMRATDVETIEAAARPDNPASLRVLEKLGFACGGAGVTDAPARGGRMAVEHMRLSRAAWAQARTREPREPREPALA